MSPLIPNFEAERRFDSKSYVEIWFLMTELPGGEKKINKGLVSGFQLVGLADVQLEVTVLPGKREWRDGEGQE